MSDIYTYAEESVFAASFPWGAALISGSDGQLLYANQSMESLYFSPDWRASVIEAFFNFPGHSGFQEVLEVVATGESWHGRVSTHGNMRGIESVELMIYPDTKKRDCLWVYTMENPVVNGSVRHSSRSEFKLLEVLLDNTLEYVFFRDASGRLILANKSFRTAFSCEGLNPISAYRVDDFVSKDSAAWFTEIDASVFSSGMPSINNTFHCTLSSGRKEWLQMSTVPVKNSHGSIVGTVSVARDISDLKRTEADLLNAIKAAEDASRAKGQFLAAMSHEIRTPINGIIGASELCLETELDTEQRAFLSTVMQCGDTLLSLVNDVLDFSKIEAGQMDLEQVRFDPASLLEDVVEEFAQIARKKRIEIIVNHDNDLPRFVMGDPTRLKQVLYNLVSNAVKFTPKGEVVVGASLVERSSSGLRIRFSVKDTGVGIDPARHDAIFSSFTQADMSTTRKYGGSGLGLTISKELVQLMEGTITVNSRLESGSEFIMEIPFGVSNAKGAEATPYNPELVGLRVLIVDDNATNRDIYERMCTSWGYRSETASDGVTAITLLETAAKENDPYLLVLLDQQMPGLTGLDVASLIESRSELSDTNVLLLSSVWDASDAGRLKEFRFARAIPKPVKRGKLLEVILEIFDVDGVVPRKTDGSESPLRRVKESLNPFGTLEEEENAAMHILLVEDNLINQQIAKRRLEKLGHRVTVVPDGKLAVEQVRIRRFDCIMMDIQMPIMDGFEATRAIRCFEEKHAIKPHFIVAMTAHALKSDAQKCISAGMDAYVAKPFRVTRLKEVLLKASKKRESIAEPLGRESADFEEVLSTMDDDEREEFLGDVDFFISVLSADLLKLKQALKKQDCDEIKFVTHLLKGAVGNFTHADLSALEKGICLACEEGHTTEIEKQVDHFSGKIDSIMQEICRYIEKHSKTVQT